LTAQLQLRKDWTQPRVFLPERQKDLRRLQVPQMDSKRQVHFQELQKDLKKGQLPQRTD
jgi:hypothetical protein